MELVSTTVLSLLLSASIMVSTSLFRSVPQRGVNQSSVNNQSWQSSMKVALPRKKQDSHSSFVGWHTDWLCVPAVYLHWKRVVSSQKPSPWWPLARWQSCPMCSCSSMNATMPLRWVSSSAVPGEAMLCLAQNQHKLQKLHNNKRP